MSAVQLNACEQFIEAMGPMIYNPFQVEKVVKYINSLHEEAPCQFSVEEMEKIVAASTEEARAGKGVSHAEIKKLTITSMSTHRKQ